MSNKEDKFQLPEPGESKRGESGYLGYLLRQAAHAYRNRVEQVLSDLHLTSPQFSALTMLAAYPGHSSADLARLALLTPQTMSVIVANLLKAKWVERRRHEVHGRILTIDVTEEGHGVLRAAKERVYALEHDLVFGLPAAQEAAIRHWLVGVAKGQFSAGS